MNSIEYRWRAHCWLARCAQMFGQVVVVNLVNKTGSEAILGERFSDLLDRSSGSLPIVCAGHKMPSLGFGFLSLAPPSRLARWRCRGIWFDFHHECRNMRWSNLSKLMVREPPSALLP
jgi:hypothetical protein